MSIPQTNLQAFRVIDQVINNLVGLQRDIYSNAQTHKAMAVAESPALGTLQAFVGDSFAEYRRRAQWLTELMGDSEAWARIVAAMPLYGIEQSDVTNVHAALVALNESLEAVQVSTFEEIIATCDLILGSIAPPLSLWPE